MEFEREEEAFRRAFAESLAGEGFRPLDPDQIKALAPAPSRQPGRYRLLAAAAAVVVVAGAAGLILPNLLASSDRASVASAPEVGYSSASGVSFDDADAERIVPAAEASDVAVSGSPLTVRSGAAGGWADGQYYLVGGTAGQRDGARYNPDKDDWRALPAAPESVASTAAATVGDRLYFVERDRSEAEDTFNAVVYDISDDSWFIQSSVPSGELAGAGGQLLSVGETVQQYDPDTRSWHAVAADPLPKGGSRSVIPAAAGASGSELVVQRSGGANRPVELAVLDVATGDWRSVPESDHAIGPAVRQGQHLYFATGEFDLEQWSWRTLPTELPELSDAVPFGHSSLYSSGVVINFSDGTTRDLDFPVALDTANLVGGPSGLLVVAQSGTDPDESSVYLIGE